MSDPPLRRLVGQNALVTGSTRGIGRTIAEWLAREGANIVVSGRERDAVEQSATAMRVLGVEVWSVPSDLARVSEAHRLAEASLSLVPRLNILVNIAGHEHPRPRLGGQRRRMGGAGQREIGATVASRPIPHLLTHAVTSRTTLSAVNTMDLLSGDHNGGNSTRAAIKRLGEVCPQ